jgi:hypothetical protein
LTKSRNMRFFVKHTRKLRIWSCFRDEIVLRHLVDFCHLCFFFLNSFSRSVQIWKKKNGWGCKCIDVSSSKVKLIPACYRTLYINHMINDTCIIMILASIYIKSIPSGSLQLQGPLVKFSASFNDIYFHLRLRGH